MDTLPFSRVYYDFKQDHAITSMSKIKATTLSNTHFLKTGHTGENRVFSKEQSYITRRS